MKVMGIFRLIAAAMLIAAIAGLPAFAQQGQAASPPATTPAPEEAGAVTAVPADIAIVRTEAFRDETTGIIRWIAATRILELEFIPRTCFNSLSDLEQRIKTIDKELEALNCSADQTSIAIKREELARLQREYKFKKDEADALVKKRYDEVLGPINDDICRALDAFGKQRGITLIVDSSSMAETGAILNADKATDVTADFIADYNSKNPTMAPASAPER